MLLGAPPTLPVLEVRRATYGHVADLSKTFDVTTEVRRIAESQGGFRLDITKDDDLAALFRDPCRGIRKKLSISYMVRGFSGTLRLDEHPQNHLRSNVRIGYPPNAAEDPFRPRPPPPPKVASIQRLLDLHKPKIDPRVQMSQVTSSLDEGYLNMMAKLAMEEKEAKVREEKAKKKAAKAERRRRRQEAAAAEGGGGEDGGGGGDGDALDASASRPTTPGEKADATPEKKGRRHRSR